MIRHGDVRWYRFAKPDRQRPVLVLTLDQAIERLHEITIAPISSTVRDVPSEVVLDESDGMSHECAINLYHLQTVPKARIGGLVASLSGERMEAVREALLFALGFDR